MVYMYHSFLVHSSADGHLGCFHVLAMTNSAAMNIGVHVSLSDLKQAFFRVINVKNNADMQLSFYLGLLKELMLSLSQICQEKR